MKNFTATKTRLSRKSRCFVNHDNRIEFDESK
jgi:hypothetical protein